MVIVNKQKKKHKINYKLLYNMTAPKHLNYLIYEITKKNLLIFYNVLHIKGFYENKKVKYIK